jgi:hypothetical protein
MTFTHRVVTTVDMQYDLEKITLTAIILHKFLFQITLGILNHINGEMVSVLASSTIDRGF